MAGRSGGRPFNKEPCHVRSSTASPLCCRSLLDIDNLWSLGGELIRCRYDDDDLAKQDVKDALQQLIDSGDGPLIWPRITESEQDSLNATFRKLNRFMRDSAATHSSA